MSGKEEKTGKEEKEKEKGPRNGILKDIDENFKPKLADDVEVRFYKTDERGDFYLVRNPRDKRYVKVHESGKVLMDSIDGTVTMAHLDETTPDINVYKFVDILAKGGFLINMEAEKKKEPFYTFKIPFFKTNKPIFIKMYNFFSFVSSKPFKIFYVLFVGTGILLFLWNLPNAFHYVVKNFDLTVPLTPLLLIMVIFYLVELAHEFAHTGASYAHGAEPGDVGIVFHFLVGFFYVETPDTRILSPKGSMDTFIAGPLTSLFAGSICTYIFVFTDHYPLVWGASAFFWHMSTLITLTPFMQTDGYYILQNRLKFPNLFSHSISFMRLNLYRIFRRISKEDYQKATKGYTKRELKVMKLWSIFMPMQIGILAFFFFFMAFQINLFHVLQIAPLILSGNHPYGIKAYVLLIMYSFSLMMTTLAASATAYKFFTQKASERWK
ncbi:MAG: hypothetical protein AYK19_02265 [Theionarchaea archaeon DG-70-1]|nr:MAG: hypothetical protein AYK19_02265 [Theionarchaea archaeon DG-70-1]